MKYLSFTIPKYRAINNPLTVDISKKTLTPIIGINECGKTTILHAILAFDYYNDTFNENLHHLNDTNNLYRLGQSNESSVSANIGLSWDELASCIDELKTEANKTVHASYKRKKSKFDGEICISRDLGTKKYSIVSAEFTDEAFNELLAKKLIESLPYILYFDDFRDSVPDQIKVVKNADGKPEGWLAMVQRLFEKTDKNFSVFNLATADERERKSILANVNKTLNNTLAKEWQNFKLDNNDALKLNLEYVPAVPATHPSMAAKEAYIKFEIVEKDNDDNDHYFYVRDRSKGFFWFFNFVMKLEFNPKIVSNDDIDAIYLLDEPGSYLHAAAQGKLCKKLRDLSERNAVIYCTHSHYLLDPELIPISSIRIASKNEKMEIQLTNIYDYKDAKIEKKNAFQPIYDALQIKPFRLDIGTNEKVVLVEGIYDFYCFDMLIEGYRFVPSQNADSIIYYISLMIGWGVSFNALWDNDKDGIAAQSKARQKYGDDIAKRTHLLPLSGRSRKMTLQNLFDGGDIKMIKESLSLPRNTSFEKVISTLYYSSKRDEILSNISDKTKTSFADTKSLLNFPH